MLASKQHPETRGTKWPTTASIRGRRFLGFGVDAKYLRTYALTYPAVEVAREGKQADAEQHTHTHTTEEEDERGRVGGKLDDYSVFWGIEFKYIKRREKFRCFLFYHITSNLKLQTITSNDDALLLLLLLLLLPPTTMKKQATPSSQTNIKILI